MIKTNFDYNELQRTQKSEREIEVYDSQRIYFSLSSVPLQSSVGNQNAVLRLRAYARTYYILV